MRCITYKSGYKYQLRADYSVLTPIRPDVAVVAEYFSLQRDGLLTIKRGYAWDGPSGPTVDTLNFMRGSLVHDALYQLMRERHLDVKRYRKPADQLLRQHCREDGMSWIRAWWVYHGVRLGGASSAAPRQGKQEQQAPWPCQG